MKDFTYIDNGFNLNARACEWLRNMGLKETLWILDTKWLIIHTTYHKWINP